MSKIINKQHNLLKAGTINTKNQLEQSKFLPNLKIKDFHCIDLNHFALLTNNEIIISSLTTSQPQRIIRVEFQIDKMIYSSKTNSFYLLTVQNRELLSITNEDNFTISSLYKYSQNKQNNSTFEWASWLNLFEQSQRIVLVRKFYGESLIIIFAIDKFQKLWQFSCNEECINKLDQSNYLVNYRQQITKRVLNLQIFNVDQKSKNIYKIDQFIDPNTTKSIKYIQKNVQALQGRKSQSWLKIVIAMNMKFNGRILLIVNLLQESNHFEIVSSCADTSQIHDILFCKSDSIFLLEYSQQPITRSTICKLALYKIDTDNGLQLIDITDIKEEMEYFKFAKNMNSMVIFNNDIKRKSIQDDIVHWNNQIKLSLYKISSKKVVYAHIIQHLLFNNTKIVKNQRFTNNILELF